MKISFRSMGLFASLRAIVSGCLQTQADMLDWFTISSQLVVLLCNYSQVGYFRPRLLSPSDCPHHQDSFLLLSSCHLHTTHLQHTICEGGRHLERGACTTCLCDWFSDRSSQELVTGFPFPAPLRDMTLGALM